MEETTPLEQDNEVVSTPEPIEITSTPEPVENAQPETKEPVNPNESARQTAERAYKELQEKQGSNGNPKEGQNKSPETKTGKQELKPQQSNDIAPPARLNPAEKQVFEKLPPQLKKAFSRSIKDLEANATRANQEAAQREQHAKGIIEAVQPFATKWAERGYTVPSAIASLAAAQEKLTNPETKFETFFNMGKDLGIDFEDLVRAQNGEFGDTSQTSQQVDITQHPQYLELQKKVDALYSTHEQAQLDSVVTPIVQEMQSVREEIDPTTGDYKYPELFDPEYLESLKPLVSAMVGNVPGLSYGEALKRAHFATQGIQTSSQQPAAPRVAPRLPAQQPQQQLNRSVSAAQTLRGRVAPMTERAGALEPPASALKDARATTAWVLENLKNGTL